MNHVAFNYFFSAGFGLALGIVCIAIPALAWYPRIADRLNRFGRRKNRK